MTVNFLSKWLLFSIKLEFSNLSQSDKHQTSPHPFYKKILIKFKCENTQNLFQFPV